MTSISPFSLIFLAILFSGVLLARHVFDSFLTRRRLPPGPPSHWFFGVQMPTSHVPETYENWRAQYGPVFTVHQGLGRYLVVVADYQAASDIMEKNGNLTADRPAFIAAGTIKSGGMRTLVQGASVTLKNMRRALHAALQPRVAITHAPTQEENARQLVLNILGAPNDFFRHADRYAGDTILRVTYGDSALTLVPSSATPKGSGRPELIAAVHTCLSQLGYAIRPGTYAVDRFPFLRFLPGWMYPPAKELRMWHQEELNLFRAMIKGVEGAKSNQGVFQPGFEDAAASFAAYVLGHQAEIGLSNDELAYLCGSMFGAGADTTASAIKFMIMASACFPEQQKLVQAKIDEVVGRDRAPCAADEEQLVWVVAYYLEVFRWRPVSQGGFAHRATEDIQYNEYIIPKGASVIGHHWTIGRTPSLFPNPEQFDFNRWLVSSPKGQDCIRDDIKPWNFGFGRRICPGLHLANRSLFLTTAMILWAFDIGTVEGEKIDTMAFTPSANVHPLPFKIKFQPRGEKSDLRKALSGI
ncbi:cytochrome P450 [Flagelloscypha sp. PMI_526]|nr:cytochrome P450 [Flagelloscypha sp. PMI_526]